VDLPVDGVVMVIISQVKDGQKVIGVNIGATKDISDISIEELHLFPKEIDISWELPVDNVMSYQYVDFDLMGEITTVDTTLVGKPVHSDIAIIDINLNTVHD
jgi:hypothetical protein